MPSITLKTTLSDADAAHCFVPYPTSTTPIAGAVSSSPLAGLRFAVKDIFDVAGYPTGCGNPHMLALSGIKPVSALAVQALAQAGATFVGKTITDELAFSMNGKNAHFGTPRNGAAHERITGGSSSGSASVVSNGLADIALGTDTGGSVRAPASHCGLIGLRPTHARIDLKGAMDLSPGFDTCGWFARDIDTFALAGGVLLGADTGTLPASPEIIVPTDLLALLNPRVQSVFAQTLQQLSSKLGEAKPVNVAAPSFDAMYWAFRHIQGYQAWQSHGETITRYGLQLGPGVKDRFAWSSQITETQLAEHSAIRANFCAHFTSLLAGGKLMVLPTMPDVAPLLSDTEDMLEDYRNQAIRMLCLSGLSGFPQISLPLMHIDGAPLGFSLIGPPGSDLALIRFARTLLA